jgi:hypothetical protein
MVVRVNGGVFNDQMITGSLRHFVCEGADFSGAINQFGQPVPNSAAEIIFTNISEDGFIDIMNPNQYNLSFALEINRSRWDGPSLTAMVRSLGSDVGVDHLDLTACTVTEVPYIWDLGGGATSFLQLSDVPHTYAGAAGYAVTVNPGETGLIFTPIAVPNAFSTIAVQAQPTITATGSDTLTFVAGSNISITTNATGKTVRIDSTGGGSSDYLPVPPGTALSISTRYYVTSSGTVTLPPVTGSGYSAGQSVIITKPNGATVFVNIGSLSDIIQTDLGSTDSVEFDATQEVIFVFNGISTWDLQIGSVV